MLYRWFNINDIDSRNNFSVKHKEYNNYSAILYLKLIFCMLTRPALFWPMIITLNIPKISVELFYKFNIKSFQINLILGGLILFSVYSLEFLHSQKIREYFFSIVLFSLKTTTKIHMDGRILPQNIETPQISQQLSEILKHCIFVKSQEWPGNCAVSTFLF